MSEFDVFRRFILFPKAFPAKSQILDTDALFQLIELERERVWAMSLTSKRTMPDDAVAHSHGCAAAAKANEALERNEGRRLDADKEPHHYLGFYSVYKSVFAYQNLEHLNVALFPLPEDGNDAHYNCMLFPKTQSGGSNKKRRNDMRDFRNYLAECMFGPERHVCDCDAGEKDRLSAIETPFVPQPQAPENLLTVAATN